MEPETPKQQGIEFEDAIDLLLFADDDLLENHYSLYKWQMEILKDFCRDEWTNNHPYQSVVRAANGSGKDKYIIAPCCLWLATRFPNTVCVVTSSSGTQLDRQTDRYIRQLAQSLNKKLGFELVKINYRHYEIIFPQPDGGTQSSFIELFVTDEAGRAEGFHPITYNSKLAIFTSEAKSVPEEIFSALARCTGFTHRVDVSSPGLPMGHFFNRCTSGNWKKYHITAFDCPHISPEYIEQCRVDYGGESSALYKSMILAEFGTTDEMVVIPYHLVYRASFKSSVPWFHEEFNTGGVDLAAGGDENVLTVRNGNKVIAVVGFKEEDTNKTVFKLEKLFKQYELDKSGCKIFGDAGGLGKPILDRLKAPIEEGGRGWSNIRYVLNNGESQDKRAYYNRGTEMWFKFGRLLEKNEIILCNDEILRRQLSTRYYKQTEQSKLLLESKLQAKAKGHPSPDRADSCILAFSGYKSKLEDPKVTTPPVPPSSVPVERPPDFSLKEHAKRQAEPDSYAKYYGGAGDNRTNLSELQELIKEHNERIRQRREQQEVTTTIETT